MNTWNVVEIKPTKKLYDDLLSRTLDDIEIIRGLFCEDLHLDIIDSLTRMIKDQFSTNYQPVLYTLLEIVSDFTKLWRNCSLDGEKNRGLLFLNSNLEDYSKFLRQFNGILNNVNGDANE